MTFWRWLWLELTGPNREFRDLDPIIEERVMVRGTEAVSHTNVRLLNQVVEAKKEA